MAKLPTLIDVLIRADVIDTSARIVHRGESRGGQQLGDVGHALATPLPLLGQGEFLVLPGPGHYAPRQLGDSTGELPACVPEEPAVGRVRRIPGDSRELQRLAVVPAGVAAAMIDRDGVLGADRVELLAGQLAVQLGVVEHVADHPEPRWSLPGPLPEIRLQLGGGSDVGVHIEQLGHAARVAVAVDEPRQDGHPGRVDDPGPRGREVPDIGIGANGEKLPILHGEGFGAG